MNRKWIAMLLCAALLMCAPAQAEETAHSLTLELLNDWMVVKADAVVYRDVEMTKPWCRISADMIVQRRYDLGNGCTAVVNGKNLGYISSDALNKLQEGEWVYAACNTRAYQRPSLRSRWVGVKQGLPMQLVAISGSCAKVRRGNAVAYMYVGHLRLMKYSWAVGA